MNVLREVLSGWAAETGIKLAEEQLDQFEKFYHMVVETNKSFNLTAIIDEKEFAVKHLIDSLTCFKAVDVKTGARVLDVGSGAGFPGMPMAIFRTDLQITLLEATEKRVKFLNMAITGLGLQNVKAVHARAEDFGRGNVFRDKYDVVVSRAVAPLAVLAEYCLPHLKAGGVFIAMKGPKTQEEIKTAQNALAVLGGAVKEAVDIHLPCTGDERVLVVISKIKATPDTYPRRAGIPAKKPL
ncbi:16S rRNA (guanine(527)-N(7))-methyltransferase RsmG [Pelotomaculum propionicicum]|uniref:16S rRNA (guanine(527)-N(7))-methyltransferase RsmG n=1 Tax=Pelotomaculum propionicicum TaxID=258475 RepID=UPI003B764442